MNIKIAGSADVDVEKLDEAMRKVVTNWLKELVDVTAVSKAAIVQLSKEISYVGWDPIKTMASFIVLNRELKEDDFRNHVLHAIVFFLTRGTNFKKEGILTRCVDPKKMTEVIASIEKLGIFVNAGNTNRMTLSRLAACYPSYTAFIVNIIKDGVPEHGLDAKYCFPHSPQIMTDTILETKLEAYLVWSYALNKRINAKNKAKLSVSFEDYKSQQTSIITAMRSGPMYTEMKDDWQKADALIVK